jgi:hypothetical protein
MADEPAALTADPNSGLTDPDEVPEAPAAPVSLVGNVWILERQHIICGNQERPSRVGVRHRQDPDRAAVEQPVGDEVHRPHLVCPPCRRADMTLQRRSPGIC